MHRTALLAVALTAGAALAAAAEEGIVVVRVTTGLAADRAGLRVGDRLLRWTQGTDQGPLLSPLALTDLEIVRGPRGPVALEGTRDAAPLAVSLFPDEWGVESRPGLEGKPLETYLAAQGLDETPRIGALQSLSGQLRDAPPEVAAWALLELARAQLPASAGDAGASAQAAVSKVALPHLQALVHAGFGEALRKRWLLPDAAQAYEEAIRLEESVDPDGLALARVLERSGFIAYARLKDFPQARARLQRALRLVEGLAPRSLAHARTLHALAQTLDSSGDARQMLERAAALTEDLAPGSPTLAGILYAQAFVTSGGEQLELARRVLAIRERVAPDSDDVGVALNLLALSLESRGMLDDARATFVKALAILERAAPGSPRLASVFAAFGNFLKGRGELADAEGYMRRALEIKTAFEPTGAGTAISLLNLADLLALRREFDEAERHLTRAIAILEREGPESDALGYCLRSAGDLMLERHDLPGAEARFRRALEIFRKVNLAGFAFASLESRLGRTLAAAGRVDEAYAAHEHALQTCDAIKGLTNLYVAEIVDDLAALASGRGDLGAAQRWYERSLAMRTQLAPGSVWVALSEHSLGVLARRRGQRAEALASFRRAVEALEAQSLRVGGSPQTRAAFRAHFQEFYRDLEEMLIEGGEQKEAFAVVERARSRALLALLSQRDLRFAEVPAALEQERRQADAEHDALVRQLGSTGPDDPQRKDLERRFEDARHRQEDVRARMRAAAPRLAALRESEPLDLDGVRGALPPATMLLAYSVGAAHSRVYVVGPGPTEFTVHDLGLTAAALRRDVHQLRTLIEARRGPALRHGLEQQARELGRILLGPAAARIPRAERILVVPDGVLHLLPFAALLDPSDPKGARYLIESKPLHVVSSVTLYAQLATPRPAEPASRVAGFGDPAAARVSAEAGGGDGATRILKLGRLTALPAAGLELEALRRIAPEGAEIWLGAEATEERAKAIGPHTRILHFATHGFVDEDFPLESGLALATPAHWSTGQDNGLLQAWEIFESVRLQADLVTLSACQTALGKEVGGEGIMGLTWAFQYAGARSVLASLWEVNDVSTAELMRRFYGYVRDGLPKVEALRRSQVDLLRRRDTSAPFFWAAFQLVGD
jgi:CHAT domain-containing protein/Tfp pilus assembly protein PilF